MRHDRSLTTRPDTLAERMAKPETIRADDAPVAIAFKEPANGFVPFHDERAMHAAGGRYSSRLVMEVRNPSIIGRFRLWMATRRNPAKTKAAQLRREARAADRAGLPYLAETLRIVAARIGA